MARAAAGGAAGALDRTPDQLPVLARAGVVDAGGRGLCLLLESLATVVAGEPVPLPRARCPAAARDRPARPAPTPTATRCSTCSTPPDTAGLRAELAELGDSLVVVGTGEGTWTVHVHVNDVGAAIEAGVRAGRPHRITVTRFADEPPARREGTAVVAVAPGAGVAELFAAEGVLLADGTEDAVLAAVLAAGTGAAVVLPGRAELTAPADAAAARARDAGVEVAVVPTRSPVQGLAAVAVHDEGRRFGDDVIAMAEAAAATRWGEVFAATRDALTMAGPCKAGDVLGLVDGEVVDHRRRAAAGRRRAAGADAVRRRRAGHARAGRGRDGAGRPAGTAGRPRPPRRRGLRARRRAAGRPAADRGRVVAALDTPLADVVGGKAADALDEGARPARPSATCCATTRGGTRSAAS